MRVGDLPLILFLIALTILATVHIVGLELMLYWRYHWFDIPMHALGGAIVSLGSQSALFHSVFRCRPHHLGFAIALVLAVGISWEVFEWGAGIVDVEEYVADTILDIVLDVCGGVVGYVVGSALRNQVE